MKALNPNYSCEAGYSQDYISEKLAFEYLVLLKQSLLNLFDIGADQIMTRLPCWLSSEESTWQET